MRRIASFGFIPPFLWGPERRFAASTSGGHGDLARQLDPCREVYEVATWGHRALPNAYE